MAEETYIQVPLKETGQVMFSTTGERQTKTAFTDAVSVYSKTGKVPDGFQVLDPASIQGKLRGMFESVNQPIQATLARGGEVVGQAAEHPMILDLLAKLGLMKPETVESRIQEGGQLGKATGQFIGSTVSRPETAAATGVLTALGLSPLRAMSGLIPPALRIAGAALGAGAGDILTGSSSTAQGVGKNVALAAMGAVAGEGITGVLRLAAGTVSQKAEEQVTKGIMTLLKNEYPELAAQGPNGINAIASTKDGLQKITSLGVKALRGSTDDIVSTFTTDINQNAATMMGKVSQRHVGEAADGMITAMNSFLDNIGDVKAQDAAKEAFKVELQKVSGVLTKEFGKDAPQKLAPVLQAFQKQLYSVEQGAQVIAALKASGAGGGFNVMSFQKIMAQQLYKGGQLMEDVGMAAGMGTPGGINKPMNVTIPSIKHSLLGIGPKTQISAGTRYPGNVQGVIPAAPADIAVIRQFLQPEEK